MQVYGDEEVQAVADVVRRRKIFRHSLDDDASYVSRLEKAYCETFAIEHVLAVNSGTSALIAALVGLGVSTGDEVIVPAYTYISTAAAALAVGGIPVIAEVDETLTLDPEDVAAKLSPHTRCIIPVHMRGWPAQMDSIMALAKAHDLTVLEDVAQANGGTYRGRHLGTIGDASAFSFQQSKLITAGEGGLVMTRDRTVYQRAALKHDSAMSFWQPGDWVPTFAGENYRMCELRGALAYTQFQRLESILTKTRRLASLLRRETEGIAGLTPHRPADPEGDCGITVGWYLEDAHQAQRFSRRLAERGVANATVYNKGVPDRHIYRYWDYVLNKQTADRTGYPWNPPYYEGNVQYDPDMCPRTLDYLGRVVTLNISVSMEPDDVRHIAAAMRETAASL